MPLPPAIQAALRFWDSAGSPAVTWNITGIPLASQPSDVSSGDKSIITIALETLYAGSTTFSTMIDNHITGGGMIRIGSSATIDVGESRTGGSIDDYVIFDVSDISKLYYFNDFGTLVLEFAKLTVAHELIHNILGVGDPGAANESTMNGAAFDFRGDTLRKQNEIALELGLTDNIQTSYFSQMLSTDTVFFSQFSVGFSYSRFQLVDISRYGTSGNDTLDHSNRTDGSFDLLFGLAGDDIIKGGDGDDNLWGGLDNDDIDGGDGDDVLVGEAGTDVLDGGAGFDLVSYELETQSVSIALFGVGPHGGAASGDTITNVEGVIGSAHDDTISLAGGIANGKIEGRGGADTLTGSDFADSILGEAGNDIIFGNDGDDSIFGDADDDTLNGGDGADFLYGQSGEDVVNGGAGVDHVYGGEGADLLDGGDGEDRLSGDAGDDILVVNNDYGAIEGGEGNDSFWFTNTTPVPLDWTEEYWIDESDATGSIRYDGNVIGASAVRFEDSNFGSIWTDSTGATYRNGGGLLIMLPTHEVIRILDWSNGDMGIYLPGY